MLLKPELMAVLYECIVYLTQVNWPVIILGYGKKKKIPMAVI